MNRTQIRGLAGAVRDDWVAWSGDRAAVIRPVLPADRLALGEFFAALSAQTRYLRFFAPVTPGAAMLRMLSGDCAGIDAVVAVDQGAIIGHAMAADRAGSGDPWPETTDIGVVVADAWQGQGVGSALVRALFTRARARGITSAAMDVLPGNHQVLAMIASHWPSARVGHCADCTTVCVSLLPEAPRFGHDDRGLGTMEPTVSYS